ncbi:MAG TPA: right-handed parallel beta-helix repeat-containing protein [Candidatus Binataceae bacterium]|nr:right-handed parallel beta-helix repeat-containing protein [Candidatus Binataceae bacterium]
MFLFRSQTRRRFAPVAASVLIIVSGVLTYTSGAFAVDGVIDIDSAVVTSFPYSITASGSYRLTSNLMVTSGADGIDISADNVTIDLNGFAITGSGGSAGNGIASTNNQVTVRNGTVTAMGGNGISLGANATVADVHAVSNGIDGIVVGNSSLVTHCTVSGNAEIGISVTGSGSVVIENSVYDNAGYGLQLNDISSSFGDNVFLGNKGNATIGSLSPTQVAPPPNGSIQVQLGSNLCNGVSCP